MTGRSIPLRRRLRQQEGWVWVTAVVALLWWAFSGLPIQLVNILGRSPRAWSILAQMWRGVAGSLLYGDNAAYWSKVGSGVGESAAMAVLGTTTAAVLAVPFGFLAARQGGRWRFLFGGGKLVLNAIRAFPELLLAIIFFRGVGPGPLAGILAMAVHSIGMLGKLYAESVEDIERLSVDALQACGANRLQVIAYAILPQVLPVFASNALYRLEINMRAATILGLVGAGGIGTPLIFSIQNRAWDQVAMILVGIVAAVSLIDLISGWLRSRLV